MRITSPGMTIIFLTSRYLNENHGFSSISPTLDDAMVTTESLQRRHSAALDVIQDVAINPNWWPGMSFGCRHQSKLMAITWLIWALAQLRHEPCGASEGLVTRIGGPARRARRCRRRVLQHWPGPTWKYGYLIQCCTLLYVNRYDVVNTNRQLEISD